MIFKIILSLFFLTSCGQTLSQTAARSPMSAAPKRDYNLEFGKWKSGWSQAAIAAIEIDRDVYLEKASFDLRPTFKAEFSQICPAIVYMDEEERKKPITLLAASLSYVESSHVPSNVTSDGSSKEGSWKSIGLFQLLAKSVRAYGGECSDVSDNSIKNPVENIQCGIRVLAAQIKKYQALFPEYEKGTNGGKGYYFGPMAKNGPESTEAGRQKLIKFFEQHSDKVGCNDISSRDGDGFSRPREISYKDIY